MAMSYLIKGVEALYPKIDRPYQWSDKENRSVPCAATDNGVLKQYYAFEQYPTVARPFECFTSTECNEIEPSDGKNVLGTLAMIEDILRPSAPSPKPYGKYMAEVDSCYDSGKSMIDNLVCAQDSKIEAIRNGSAATPQNIEERWELD